MVEKRHEGYYSPEYRQQRSGKGDMSEASELERPVTGPEEPKTEDCWHVDRRIPVAVLFAIMAQTFMGVWWVASTTKEMEQQSNRLTVVERYVESTRGPALVAAERFTRVEVRMENIESGLTEIKNLIRGKATSDGRN